MRSILHSKLRMWLRRSQALVLNVCPVCLNKCGCSIVSWGFGCRPRDIDCPECKPDGYKKSYIICRGLPPEEAEVMRKMSLSQNMRNDWSGQLMDYEPVFGELDKEVIKSRG